MSEAASPISTTPRWHDRDGPVLAVLIGWILVVFALPWNPWWMPSGDAEVFVTVGRNLLEGRGLVYNGHPIAFIPPGWPLVLSLLLRITDQYLWLKAVQIVLLAVYLVMAYLILRRFTSPRLAGLACGLAAILWPLYPLTMWLHSDPLFCAITALAGLMALKWGDGRLRPRGAWLVAIVAGCAMAVLVRWAALPHALVLCALICGSGRDAGAEAGRSPWWPHLSRWHWIGIIMILLSIGGTFLALQLTLPSDEAGAAMARSPAAGPAGPILAMATIPEERLTPGLFNRPADSDATLGRDLLRRFLSIPQWVSWTLFAPIRVAGGFGLWGALADRTVGLLALGLLAVTAVRGARRREYLWLGVLLNVLALAIAWPHVNNRYLVPVAPFLIAGILLGLGELARHRVARLLRWSFVAALLAINGGLWAVDVVISRSGNAEEFYARLEAGIHLPLIEIGHYLRHEAEEGDVVVASARYVNLTERWDYKLSQRAVILMADHHVDLVPRPLTGSGVRKLQSWARENDVRFYVHQNPTVPGRFWHFRVSPEIERRITGYLPPPERPQYELYEMLPDPIPQNPDLRSLKYVPVPALRGEALERITRRVPRASP